MKQLECLRYIVENSKSIEPRYIPIKVDHWSSKIFLEKPNNDVILPDMPEGMCEKLAELVTSCIEKTLRYNSNFDSNYLVRSILHQVSYDIFEKLFENQINGRHIRKERKALAQIRSCVNYRIEGDKEKTCEMILRLYKYSLNPTPENIATIRNALDLVSKGSI